MNSIPTKLIQLPDGTALAPSRFERVSSHYWPRLPVKILFVVSASSIAVLTRSLLLHSSRNRSALRAQSGRAGKLLLRGLPLRRRLHWQTRDCSRPSKPRGEGQRRARCLRHSRLSYSTCSGARVLHLTRFFKPTDHPSKASIAPTCVSVSTCKHSRNRIYEM